MAGRLPVRANLEKLDRAALRLLVTGPVGADGVGGTGGVCGAGVTGGAAAPGAPGGAGAGIPGVGGKLGGEEVGK
jgi:hypothetical protein